MERSALFVDAGYLLAATGELLFGTKVRRDIGCRYAELVEELHKLVRDHGAPLPLLRTYWYDGGPDRRPTAEHELVGEQSYVSLRLGSLKRYGQKGVDALLYRDLTTLARERAVSRAYVIAGDEDLLEGVTAAQDLGVQVILIGVSEPPGSRRNQALPLMREADELMALGQGDLQPLFFHTKAGSLGSQQASPGAAENVGEAYGEDWANRLDVNQLFKLHAGRPSIPHDLDAHLMKTAKRALQDLEHQEPLRAAFRKGFWTAVDTAVAAQAPSP